MILDVGCLGDPASHRKNSVVRSDVGIDVVKPLQKLKHRIFIRASACYLPFRDNIFDSVECNHVIEHTDKPALVLRELIRVSKNEVHIKVPHRFSRWAKSARRWKHSAVEHRCYFGNKWWRNELEKYPVEYSLNDAWFFLGKIEIQIDIIKTE